MTYYSASAFIFVYMRYLLFLLPFLLPAITANRSPAVRAWHLTGTAQGTTWQMTYYATDSIVTKRQIDSILDKIDSSLSIYKPYSLISQFNQSDSGIDVDDHFVQVIKASLETYHQTGGIFDVTVQPLVQAWGFSAKKINTLPDSLTIQSLRQCVDSRYLLLRGHRLIKLKPCVKIDVNGIAQGYSVDVLAGFLEQNRIRDYIVELGGEIRVKGRKQPSNEKMKIGIESPGDDPIALSMMQTIIQLDSGAITTSGSYRRYYESNGKKISHLIDPRTGYSMQNELISVTVYAKDAITADAYDNALMVMGLHDAMQFVEKHKEMAAYFIYHNGAGKISDTASSLFYKFMNP